VRNDAPGRFFRSLDDHDAWSVTQVKERDIESVAQHNETRSLIGTVTVDCPSKVHRVVRNQPYRSSLDPDERGYHRAPEMGTQFEYGIAVRQILNHRVHVVNAQSVFRNNLSQDALVDAFEPVNCTLKVGQIFSGGASAFRLVNDRDIHDATRHLHTQWSNLFGAIDAQPSAFDHCWTAHADIRVGRRDHYVAASEQ